MRNKVFERRFVMVLFCLMASFFLVTAALGAEEAEKQAAGSDASKAEGEPAPAPEATPAKPADTPVASKPGGQIPWPDAYQERQVPFERELSEEDYQWLGRQIWESMQKIVPREQSRGLNAREIHALMLQMRRERGEANLQMGDFMRILNTRSKKCGPRDHGGFDDQLQGEGREPMSVPKEPEAPLPQGAAIGFDLGRLRAPRH